MRRERRFLLTVWNDGEGTAHRARLEPLRGGPAVLVAVLADLHVHLRAALDAGRGAPRQGADAAGGDAAAGADAAGADATGADATDADAALADATCADARAGATPDLTATPAGPETARPPPHPPPQGVPHPRLRTPDQTPPARLAQTPPRFQHPTPPLQERTPR